MEVDDIFEKIRPQISSKLDNQRQAALVLRAVEDTIREQNEDLVPLSYFGAMMTMLEQQQALNATAAEQEQLITAITYLLSFVFPRIPSAVLRMKLPDIAKPLLSTLESHHQNAPIVRAIISCMEYLVVSQDASSWSQETSKQVFLHLLNIILDARPKVRRRAQEATRRVLSRPPPPSAIHPCTVITIEYCHKCIKTITSQPSDEVGESLDKKSREQAGLHLLGFLKLILPVLAAQANNAKAHDAFEALCLDIIKLAIKGSVTATPMMTQLVYDTFGPLFSSTTATEVSAPEYTLPLNVDLVDTILQALMQVRPYQNDAALVPAWLGIVSMGLVRLAATLRQAESFPDMTQELNYASKGYPALFTSFFAKTYTPYLGSSTKSIVLDSTTDAFVNVIKNGVLESMLWNAANMEDNSVEVSDESMDSVHSVMKLVNSSLSNARYRDAWGGILKLCQALFERCGQRHFSLIRNILVQIISIRDNASYATNFPYRAELEAALEHATRCFGTELFLSAVSLNVEKEDTSEAARPYLLAMFGKALQQFKPSISSDVVGPPAIRFFVSHWIPFATRMMEKSAEYRSKNKELESKLYETLAIQTWDLLPGICSTRPHDVADHFGKLGPTLGRILQTPPESVFAHHSAAPDLRPVVCTSLSNLVEGFLEVSSTSPVDEESQDLEAMRLAQVKQGALTVLKSYAGRFLSVLCNNYTQVPPELMNAKNAKAKGQALQEMHEKANRYYEQAISSFLKVVEPSVIEDHFLNVFKALLAMQNEEDAAAQQLAKFRSYSMHDLLMMMVPHLSLTSLTADSPFTLFYNFLLGELKEADVLLQKRVYRCLSVQIDLVSLPSLDLKQLAARLMEADVVAKCTSGAKKTRLGCLGRVVERIPVNDAGLLFEFVPMVLGEVILGTKETSEKARLASYECLVSMGRKMLDGGQDKDETLWGDIADDDDEDGDDGAGACDKVEAAVMEVDESSSNHAPKKASFKEYLMMVLAGLAGGSTQMQSACISSISRLLFEFKDYLSSAMVKEIVSTVLFCVESPQREVVKAAIGFVKVAIVCLPPELLVDHLELIITAILKHSRDTRSHFRQKVRHILERLIRRFSIDAVAGFIPEPDRKLLANIRKRRDRARRKKSAAAPASRGTHREFEDVMNDSGSELDSDREDVDARACVPGRGGDARGASIREDAQHVLDFLDPQIVSRVSSGAARKRARAVSAYATASDGRVVVADSDAEDDDAAAKPPQPQPDYYKLSQEGESAFVRLRDGRIKFEKGNKKRKHDDDDGDVDVDADHGVSKRKKRDGAKPIGAEYRAKNAGGDVKKKGKPDPYAYIPLHRKGVGKGGRAATFKSVSKSAKPSRSNSGYRQGGRHGNKTHKR
ncbi:hypothetical protein SeMB42_g06227 [Synchytrium endobioticum]|uniref:Uncharacterized protein n=1 Tax=Synchytrium endobioticum TaxID=286115 RepID=A0A507CQI3_9FUNG|nr:hypothetical protein SeMB42_g06227 [Synchytrium endobioticum]TPX41348.1 hypothetical protein SeLEV6574_g06129 [Synchytrium endobioticum]